MRTKLPYLIFLAGILAVQASPLFPRDLADPACFFCSADGLRSQEAPEDCFDLCSDQKVSLGFSSDSDCSAVANSIGDFSDIPYFIHDSGVCYNYSPRDALKRVLPNHSAFTDESQRRHLISYCAKSDNCFDCASTGSLCEWQSSEMEGSGCVYRTAQSEEDQKEKKWFDYFETCTDYKKLCVNWDRDENRKVFQMQRSSNLPIPKNYFCKFQYTLHPNISYGVEILRFNRYQPLKEQIDIQFSSDVNGTERTQYISDTTIRKNSLYSRMQATAKATLVFRIGQSTADLEFFAQNNFETRDGTFQIGITRDFEVDMSQLMNYQSMFLSFLFCMVCFTCFFRMVKHCIMNCHIDARRNRLRQRYQQNTGSGANQDEANELEIRIQEDLSSMEMRSRKKREEELKKIEAMLDKIVFDEELKSHDEFALEECVVCMEPFQEGQNLVRIPVCMHFFHPGCLEQWFKSKSQIRDAKRCPLCNSAVDLNSLKAAKATELLPGQQQQ